MKKINCKLCKKSFTTKHNARKYCVEECYLKSRIGISKYAYTNKWRENHPHYNRDWMRKKRALLPKKPQTPRIPTSLEFNEGNKAWKKLIKQEKDWYKKVINK